MTEQLNDPLPTLWAEWQSIEERHHPDSPEALAAKRSNRQAEIEKEMARHTPSTLEGAAALAHLLKDLGVCDDRQTTLCDNLITGLKDMDGDVNQTPNLGV